MNWCLSRMNRGKQSLAARAPLFQDLHWPEALGAPCVGFDQARDAEPGSASVGFRVALTSAIEARDRRELSAAAPSAPCQLRQQRRSQTNGWWFAYEPPLSLRLCGGSRRSYADRVPVRPRHVSGQRRHCCRLRRRHTIACAALASMVLLSGCGKQSILDPHSPQAHRSHCSGGGCSPRRSCSSARSRCS